MLKYEKNERVYLDLLGYIFGYGYLLDIVIVVFYSMIFRNMLLYLCKEEFICLVNILEVDLSGNS